jgi:hypothetical protein
MGRHLVSLRIEAERGRIAILHALVPFAGCTASRCNLPYVQVTRVDGKGKSRDACTYTHTHVHTLHAYVPES